MVYIGGEEANVDVVSYSRVVRVVEGRHWFRHVSIWVYFIVWVWYEASEYESCEVVVWVVWFVELGVWSGVKPIVVLCVCMFLP